MQAAFCNPVCALPSSPVGNLWMHEHSPDWALAAVGPPPPLSCTEGCWLESWLEAFLRSFLLLYLLSTVRLFLLISPLKADRPRRNAAIVGCRRGLRGVPLAFALLSVAWCLPTATPMRPALPIPAPRPAASETVRPTTVSAGASRTPFITECPGLFCKDDFRFEIAVLRFQRIAIQTSLLWDPGLSAGYVCATVRDDLGICDPDTVFVPAIPQPDNKIVVIGEVAVSALKALQVPVFLQVDGAQEPCFLVCFVGAITKADIRAAAGMHWPKDAEVFVGFCQTPMREADCVNPTQGLLFRLVPPGRLPAWHVLWMRKLQTPMICSTLQSMPCHSPFRACPELASLPAMDYLSRLMPAHHHSR